MVASSSREQSLEDELVSSLRGLRDEQGRPDFRATLLAVVRYIRAIGTGVADLDMLVDMVKNDDAVRQRLGVLF